jgi:hypothetical protein
MLFTSPVVMPLTFATFLTLVLVPVMHSLTDDLTTFLDRHLRRSQPESSDEPGSSDERGAGSREPEVRPEERKPELVTAARGCSGALADRSGRHRP